MFGVPEEQLRVDVANSADEAEAVEHLDGFSTIREQSAPSKKDIVSMFWHWLDIPILLLLIGFSSALISFATKTVVNYNSVIREHFLSMVPPFWRWPLFCLYSVVMALTACFLSQLICKECVGGGFADMKTILGGVVKPVLLSRRLIVAKALGLWFSLMGGLSVGKEGPYVHISGAIADQLMKLSPFQHIRRQDSKRLEILACACASGVSATFGNAFGGVLFSIEFTSSAYLVRTLPKAFLTSVAAMLAFLFLGVSDELSLFQDQNQSIYVLPKFNELAVFFLLGMGGGLLSMVFVMLVEMLVTMRNSLLDTTRHPRSVVTLRRYLMVGTVTLFVSSALYVELLKVPHTGGGSFALLQFLFGKEAIETDVVVTLCFFTVYKFFATLMSVTLPLPVGLFTPTFVIGGLLGRIVGEVLQVYPGYAGYAPWEYAILGAAAFSTGVTRAISTSVIIFELACQPHLGLPLSVVVLTAHFTGNRFSKNVYDVLVEANGGPNTDDLPPELYTVPIAKVMMPIEAHHVLALESTYQDAVDLLEATEAAQHGVDNHSSNGIYVVVGDNGMDAADSGPGVQLVDQLPTPLPARAPEESLGAPDERQGLLARQRSAEGRRSGRFEMPSAPGTSVSAPGATAVRRFYAPTVIPVVQSKASMVIVGAVLRKDVQESLRKLQLLNEVAQTTPVVLGRADGGGSGVGYGSVGGLGVTPAVERLLGAGLHNIDRVDSEELAAPSVDQHNPLNETIQFIIVTDDGRSIQPVVNAARARRLSTRRSISFHALPMAIPLDPSPYQIVDTMHLSKVDMVFRLLSLNQAYVTNSGRVVGIVTRSLLREFLGGRGKRPTDRIKKFCWDLYAACFGTGSTREQVAQNFPSV